MTMTKDTDTATLPATDADSHPDTQPTSDTTAITIAHAPTAATTPLTPLAAQPTAASTPLASSTPAAGGSTAGPAADSGRYWASSAPGYAGAPTATFTPPPVPTGNPVPQYYAPAPRKTNTLGIITLVLGVLGFGLVPVITGHIALGQIKQSGEDGRGITLAGLILGYVTLAGWLAAALFWVAFAGLAVVGSAVTIS
jgi:hypothetical protein